MAEFRVSGLAPQDAGRGIARLTQAGREELGVEPDDVVTITGRRRTVAKVAGSYKGDEADVVRIDGNVRINADVNVDDSVEVEAVDPEPASSITVALPDYVILRGAEPLIHRYLVDRPVIRGDTVQMRLLGQPFVFLVTKTSPSGPTVITEETEVRIRETPITEEDLRGRQDALPDITYEDIGGLGRELDLIREMIELPLRHPELFRRLGVAPPKGVLLHGPPGTGKTLIAKAVANEVDASFHEISGPEIMSKYYGESEQHLREVFDEAQQDAPAIVFVDEIDSIAPSRDEVTGETERRVVAQLLSLMDGLEARGDVIVIAATNRPDAIDSALRRGGRFDREIEVGVPGREGRLEVLQIHTKGMPLADDVDLEELAEHTHGFVGADLASLARESAMHAIRRVQPDLDMDATVIPADVLESIEVTATDFAEARQEIEPSAMREVYVEVPDVTYDDVGGLDPVKRELVRAVEWPLRYPQLFDKLRTEAPRGVLLYGPPGTGKTLLARAVANASGVNFISVKGPELLDKFVGESERGVREVFQRARQSAPTIIFFDEIDAIALERGGSFDSRVTERVVSQLLTELDGIEALNDVFVMGATNRPDVIDPALLRPGRLEKNIYVPIPDVDARRAIFAVHTRGVPAADDVDLDALAEETEGYTGGDIEAIVREASMLAMDEVVLALGGDGEVDETPDEAEIDEAATGLTVSHEHFRAALEKVKPSVTDDRREFYEEMVNELGGKAQTDADDGGLGFQ
ncbi:MULTISPECIES: CDC48 family AAA ATPase [Halorussus]|uniref:CDC48 family AAA ATPase n=1 Tax=Halorussus TaxID=1070314 RepID=UPI0020A14713|nr:CDC48 family AAA ATPase [Halorussus vallis]USZ74134.1 CDC48 family AAA ATPase [Halorussus vallis]